MQSTPHYSKLDHLSTAYVSTSPNRFSHSWVPIRIAYQNSQHRDPPQARCRNSTSMTPSINIAMSSATFTLFPLLPVELQIEVFRHAINDSNACHFPRESRFRTSQWPSYSARRQSHVGPLMLSIYVPRTRGRTFRGVCRLSRMVLLEWWRAALLANVLARFW